MDAQDTRTRGLVEALANEHALLVIGSGVTFQATNASTARWIGLLENGINYSSAWGSFESGENPTAWQIQLSSWIKIGGATSLVTAGHEIEKKLNAHSGGAWASWLREAIGSLRPVHPRILTALKLLADRFRPIITTTNYDLLLESYFGVDPIAWSDVDASADVIFRRSRNVLHLHGHWKKPDSIVFGIKSYDTLIKNEFAQTAQRSAALANSFVFIGCGDGIDDENIGGLMEWIDKTLSTSERRHFILLKEDNVHRFRKDTNLVPISYGPEYSDLPNFLDRLRGLINIEIDIATLTAYSGTIQAPNWFPSRDFVDACADEINKVQGLSAMDSANEARAIIDPKIRRIRRGELPLEAVNQVFWEAIFRAFGTQSVRSAAAILMSLPEYCMSNSTITMRDSLLTKFKNLK